jgi:hypothetical protein
MHGEEDLHETWNDMLRWILDSSTRRLPLLNLGPVTSA